MRNIFYESNIRCIRKTCPCNVYPIKPRCYIEKKAGVCRGIPDFLIFALKHRLWLLIRTASDRVPTINVLSKNIKKIKIILTKFPFFTAEKFLSILQGNIFVMESM